MEPVSCNTFFARKRRSRSHWARATNHTWLKLTYRHTSRNTGTTKTLRQTFMPLYVTNVGTILEAGIECLVLQRGPQLFLHLVACPTADHTTLTNSRYDTLKHYLLGWSTPDGAKAAAWHRWHQQNNFLHHPVLLNDIYRNRLTWPDEASMTKHQPLHCVYPANMSKKTGTNATRCTCDGFWICFHS